MIMLTVMALAVVLGVALRLAAWRVRRTRKRAPPPR